MTPPPHPQGSLVLPPSPHAQVGLNSVLKAGNLKGMLEAFRGVLGTLGSGGLHPLEPSMDQLLLLFCFCSTQG